LEDLITKLKSDLDRLLTQMGHSIIHIKIRTFVREGNNYKVTGECESLEYSMFESPKIMGFTGTYNPEKREFESFEITSERPKI
jgi:hypothetical protein